MSESHKSQDYLQMNSTVLPLADSTSVSLNVQHQSVFPISWAPILSLYIHIKTPSFQCALLIHVLSQTDSATLCSMVN